MGVLRRAKNLKELSRQFDAVKSGVAGDTNFTAAALLWLCEHMDSQQQVFRQELMASRKVEATLADRIAILEDAARLKELAHQLGEVARQLEKGAASERPALLKEEK